MRTLGLFLLLLQSTGMAFASVPPEIPGDRTFQRFSPFHFSFHDMGEATLQSDLQKLKYSLAGYYTNDVEPSEPNPDDLEITNPSYDGLTAFDGIIGSEAGVLFWATHGGKSPVNVMVFAYCDSDDCKQEAVNAIVKAVDFGGYDLDELTLVRVGDSPQYWGIGVTPTFFENRIAKHAVVAGLSCDSYSMSDSVLSNNVENYVSVEGEAAVSILPKVASAIFDNMSGIANDANRYGNIALGAAVPLAQYQIAVGGVSDMAMRLTPNIYEKGSQETALRLTAFFCRL